MPGLASASSAWPSIGPSPLVSRSPVQAKVNMAQLLSTAESRHSSAAFHAWLVHTLLLAGEMRSLPGRPARPGESSPPHKPNNAPMPKQSQHHSTSSQTHLKTTLSQQEDQRQSTSVSQFCIHLITRCTMNGKHEVFKQLGKLYRQEVEDSGESGAWWLVPRKESQVRFSLVRCHPGDPVSRPQETRG